MRKTFEGWLYNRIETLGKESFNHVGCKGVDEQFIDFLAQFVPEEGMQRRVKFTIETKEEPQLVNGYKKAKSYKKEYNKK
jgi:hypothetical protein